MIFDFMKNMIELLPQCFGNYSPESNVYKFLNAFADEMDELKQTFDDMLAIWNIDEAYGVYLDDIGRLLSVSRGSLEDEEYRKILKTEIIANKSNGNTETVREVASVIFPYDIGIKEMWTETAYGNEEAGLVVQVVGDLNDVNFPEPTVLKAVSGGVRTAFEPKLNDEIIVVQEPDGQVVTIVSIRTGTLNIPGRMGELF